MNDKRSLSVRFDRWLFGYYSLNGNHWGLFRIGYALFMLGILGLPELVYLSELPDVFFHPRSFNIARLFSGFPDPGTAKILGVLINLAFLCILFGFRTRTASIVGVILVFFAKSFVYSTGQINHDFMVWLVPIAGAFGNWGAAYSIDAKKRNGANQTAETQSWPITFLVVIFCFAFALSGIHKLIGGWATPDLGAVQQWHARAFVVTQRQDFLSPLMLQVDNLVIWKSLDYLTLIFEIGILAGIFYLRIFRIFLLVAVVFHTGNLLLLNIDFSFNLAFYALFLNWEKIDQWAGKSLKAMSLLKNLLRKRVFFLACAIYLPFFFMTESSVLIFILSRVGIEYLGNALVRTLLGVGIAVWAIHAGLGGNWKSLLERPNKSTEDATQ